MHTRPDACAALIFINAYALSCSVHECRSNSRLGLCPRHGATRSRCIRPPLPRACMLARSQPLPATLALQGRQQPRASPAVTRPQPRLSASASRRSMAPSAALQGAEVFVHPQYGRAVRATERLPAGAVVLKERPFFTTRPSAKAVAEAAKVRIVRSQSPRSSARYAFVRVRNGGLRCAPVTKLQACEHTRCGH